MPKILLVEDDPMISEIYTKKFAESGFDVLNAEDGEQVLKVAKDEKLDVILLDLMMPKMDGFQVVEKLRGGGYDPKIQIIISSNLSERDDRDKAIKLGANGFLAKSEYTPSDLVKEVQRLLGQYQERMKNEEREQSGPAKKKDGKRILMIEDEEIFLEMFGEKLKQEGYDVAFATNGAWGVKEALKSDFDLFIIDMVMPALTGEEMVGKLKMEDKTKNVPIVILSASVDDELRKTVENMGINAFFVKTQITPSELSKKVEELIGK